LAASILRDALTELLQLNPNTVQIEAAIQTAIQEQITGPDLIYAQQWLEKVKQGQKAQKRAMKKPAVKKSAAKKPAAKKAAKRPAAKTAVDKAAKKVTR
jgi:phosphopantetheinyl transferase (holo-ACP synthase)